MQHLLMQRRYKQARFDGVRLWLDDKELLTPAQRAVQLPLKLATEVAAEWEAQGEKINPASMPMTQLAFTAIDRVADNRALIIDELLNYLETELICHYGEVPELVAHQKKHWQKLHEWLQERFGINLPVTTSIQALRAVPNTAWAADYMQNLTDLQLTALQQAVAVTTSLVIGLALTDGQITAAEALDAAEAEADYQAEKWGRDDEFITRRMGQLTDLEAVSTFLTLLRD